MSHLTSIVRRVALETLLLFAVALVVPNAARAAKQAIYPSPQAAVDALIAAVKANDLKQIINVLGPGGRELARSGDPVADAATRETFLSAYDDTHEIRDHGDRATLILGTDAYPFPIPLVGQANAWRFDTAAGAEEILDRRIGENELSAIEVMRACVDAQHEYAEVDRDGKGVQYARRVLSRDGKADGLYWPADEGALESPLGPLVAEARAEGYAASRGHPTPYHGYLFRVLTSQGKDAPGGARNYIVRDRMIGGFGLIAVPADYGNSGVKTFIVNQDGQIFEKDLGDQTARLARRIEAFNPGPGWTVAPAQ